MSPSNAEKDGQRLEADGSRLAQSLKHETDAVKRELLRRELEELIAKAKRASTEGRALGTRIQEWMAALDAVVGPNRHRHSHGLTKRPPNNGG